MGSSGAPVAKPLSGDERKGVTYVRPELVAEIEFTEWTADGILRHPSFEGLREDKAAKDVVRERPRRAKDVVAEREAPVKRASTKRPPARSAKNMSDLAGVTLTHPERVLFPDLG